MRKITTFIAFGLLVAVAGCSDDDDGGRTVTITHPALEAPTYLDLGDEGASVGDVRLFHFDAESDGSAVSSDGVMTTTAVDAPEVGLQVRLLTVVFTFVDSGDQLILEGTASYPGEGSTLKVASSSIRSIVGGSGEYAGASGWVESIHHDDGTWSHIFHLED